MVRDDDVMKADALLMEHHYWQESWRPKLGYGNCSPECRHAISSRQFDTTADITREQADNADMEAVDWCINELPFASKVVIGKEMLKRAGKRMEVLKECYDKAVQEVLPLMRKRGLL